MAYKKAVHVVIFFAGALILFFLFSGLALAQNKFFGSPNRGIEGSKGSVQIQALNDGTTQNSASIRALQNTIDTSLTTVIGQVDTLQAAVDASLTAVSDCGNLGMLGGPEHATANAQDCLPSLVIEPTGKAVFNQLSRHQQGVILGDNPTCDLANEGMLRYSSAHKSVMLCTGTTWTEIGTAPAASGVFTTVTDANLDQSYTSNSVSLSGFFGVKTATATNGAIIVVNGVAQGASANVEAGDVVALRMPSSTTFNTVKSTTLSLSSYSQTWTITTKPQDVTPNVFSFTDLTHQELTTLVTSNSVNVSGFDGPLTASVSGSGNPQLQVAGGAWVTSAPINPGQSVQLRLSTSANFMTAHTADITIGSISTTWSATTKVGKCTLPWGGTINSGESVTAFQTAVAPSGGSCGSQVRQCEGEALSGSYIHQDCTLPQVGQLVIVGPREFNWVVPEGITSVSVVAVGGGGHDNASESLTALGTSHFNEQVVGFSNTQWTRGGGFIGQGGGRGGSGGRHVKMSVRCDSCSTPKYVIGSGSAGGAGGYTGNGGTGYNGSRAGGAGSPGGGVGLLGEGASGLPNGAGGGGGGGRSGANSPGEDGSVDIPGAVAYGGGFGARPSIPDGRGGGGLGWTNNIPVTPGASYPIKAGARGAVRVIWPGHERGFPSTRTQDECDGSCVCTTSGENLQGGICTEVGNNALISATDNATYNSTWALSRSNAMSACSRMGDGWSLPTIAELKVLYNKRDMIGGFATWGSSNYQYYWSSTNLAINFIDGSEKSFSNTTKLRARCVRRMN